MNNRLINRHEELVGDLPNLKVPLKNMFNFDFKEEEIDVILRSGNENNLTKLFTKIISFDFFKKWV